MTYALYLSVAWIVLGFVVAFLYCRWAHAGNNETLRKLREELAKERGWIVYQGLGYSRRKSVRRNNDIATNGGSAKGADSK